MGIDRNWLSELDKLSDLATRDTLVINGVEIELPKTNPRGKERVRDWQRRVLPDIMPDSVNADAPERTPFRLLHVLTSSPTSISSIDEVLSGEFAPLEELFRAESRGKKKMTLAFHVLAVKAANAKESEAKGYTERTLLLLCRRPDGSLDEQLVRDLVEQFRRHPDKLDLAQRTLLGRLCPGWTPNEAPIFALPESVKQPEIPFDPGAARLFQEDLRTLIDARLPPADFFHHLNLLFTLHLGLYQPRVAALLNPQMEYLFAQMSDADARSLRDLDLRLEEFQSRHPFTGKLSCRAPDPELRKVTLRTPARDSYEATSVSLAKFHFNLLLLFQLRRLTEAFLANRWGVGEAWRSGTLGPDKIAALAREVRGPRELLVRIRDDPEFAPFLDKALTALAARFVLNQIADVGRDDAFADIGRAQSSLHALARLYERYNIQSSRNAASSRANMQGIQITSSLLQQGQYGLVQSRQRIGAFFEVGAGLLPLLLLLVVGAGREKVPVSDFWRRLNDYGLSFDRDESERVLGRLRAMGVHERYSDAGEAAYVRNLMTSEAAT